MSGDGNPLSGLGPNLFNFINQARFKDGIFNNPNLSSFLEQKYVVPPPDNGVQGPSNEDPPSVGDAAAALERLNALLEHFKANVKDPSLLARAMIELAAFQRESAVEARAAAREEAKSALLDAAQKSKDAASELKTAAAWALVGGLISATVSIGMGALAGYVNKKGGLGDSKTELQNDYKKVDKDFEDVLFEGGTTKDMKQVQLGRDQAKFEYDSKLMNLSSSQVQLVTLVGQGAQSAFGGGATSASKTEEAQAQTTQAEGQEMQALAQDIQNQQDQLKQAAEDLTNVIKAVIQFLKQMQDAEVERMSMVNRMGG